MRRPIFVRPLTDAEQHALTAGLRSSDAFVLRRCQILLASARGEQAPQIARHLGCDDQTVLDALHAFNASGLDTLQKGSSRPQTTHPAFSLDQAQRLRALLHRQPPRIWQAHQFVDAGPAGRSQFPGRADPTPGNRRNHPTDLCAAGHPVETRQALDHQSRCGVYAQKNQRDRLIALAQRHPDWVVGFGDEVWWSRVARPTAHAWQEPEHPVRLVEQTVSPDDPDPKALACYGLLIRQRDEAEQVWLRFVEGRLVSAITTQFLDWCCAKLTERSVPVLLLGWDNAAWHISRAVRTWIRTHNQQVKRERKGVRILPCCLPVKSPWLNPIEPKWVHSKRAIVEPARLLSAQEVAERVCTYLGCTHEPHLSIPDEES